MKIGHVLCMFGFLALVGCDVSLERRPSPQESRCVITETLWPSAKILEVIEKSAFQYEMTSKDIYTLSKGRILIVYNTSDSNSRIVLSRSQSPNEVSISVYVDKKPNKARLIADELVLKMSGIGGLEAFGDYDCGREFRASLDESYEAWVAVEDFFN